MDYLVPARGLIGFRTEFLTETRGTGIMHHVFDRWEPWAGELLTRQSGALVADRRGSTVTFSLFTLQERGTLFVGPGEEVYEGMIIGENARSEDLDVNPVKEKHLTNMRSSTSDVLVRLDAHRKLTLDEALEFVREDEAVEATPVSVRMRKVVLAEGRAAEGCEGGTQVSRAPAPTTVCGGRSATSPGCSLPRMILLHESTPHPQNRAAGVVPAACACMAMTATALAPTAIHFEPESLPALEEQLHPSPSARAGVPSGDAHGARSRLAERRPAHDRRLRPAEQPSWSRSRMRTARPS